MQVSILKVGTKKMVTRLFPVVPSDRMTSSGHTPTHKKFPLNTRKNFTAAEHWHRLPRETDFLFW